MFGGVQDLFGSPVETQTSNTTLSKTGEPESEYGLVVNNPRTKNYDTLPLEEVVISTTILKDLFYEVSVTQRYRVPELLHFSKNVKTNEIQEVNVEVDKIVEIRGLQSEQGQVLNGKFGVVTGQRTNGRWEVQLFDQDKTIAVNPENLVIDQKLNDERKCSNQHALTRFSVPNDTFICDACEQPQPKGSTLFGCRLCNYDECYKCYRLRSYKKGDVLRILTDFRDFQAGQTVHISYIYPNNSIMVSGESLGPIYPNEFNNVEKIGEQKKTCSGNHPLTKFITKRPNFTCDQCNQIQPKGSTLYGCRRCDYDECSQCYETIENHIHAACGNKMEKRNSKPETYKGSVYCDQCGASKLELQTMSFWHCAQCQYDICYTCKNNSAVPKEYLYRFPLPSNAAIHTFTAHLVHEGRTIVGEVKEKDQARKEYNDAVAQGMNAYLMERMHADVFSIKIGNLGEGEQVDVTLKYVGELDVIDGKIQWVMPLALAPRYFATYESTTVNYPISLTLDCWCNSDIVDLSMKSDVYRANSNFDVVIDCVDPCHRTLTMDTLPSGLTDDLEFYLQPEYIPEITAVLERSLDYNTETLRITIAKNMPQIWTEAEGDVDQKVELYFLLDTSGSMYGDRIENLKTAMQIFLRSMPEDARYQLIEFNYNFSKCFNTGAVDNTQQNLEKASEWCKRLTANGGTNIYDALNSVYGENIYFTGNFLESSTAQESGARHKKCIIVLTDGDVSNADQCKYLVRNNRNQYSVYTLGVGTNFSEGLCRGLADAGGGLFRSARRSSDIASSCIAILQATFAQTVSSHEINLGAWDDGQIQHRYPQKVSFVSGKKVDLYFVKNIAREGGNDLPAIEEFVIDINVSFSANPIVKKTVATVPVSISPLEGHQDITVSTNKIIHRLMAKSRIMEIENTGKAECIALGTRYNLLSKYTSFVAVNYKEGIPTDMVEFVERQPVIQETSHNSLFSQNYTTTRLRKVVQAKSKCRSKSKKRDPSFGGVASFFGDEDEEDCPPIVSNLSAFPALGSSRGSGSMWGSASTRSTHSTSLSLNRNHANIGSRNSSRTFSASPASSDFYSAPLRGSILQAQQESYATLSSASARPIQRSSQGSDLFEDFGFGAMQAPQVNSSYGGGSQGAQVSYSSLIQAQQVNGSFNLNITNTTVNGITELYNMGLSKVIVQTLVAIWLLRNMYADKQNEWILMVKKAKSYVTKNSNIDATTIESYLAKLSK